MLTITNTNDVRMRDALLFADPFQFAAPCWRVRVWNQLPPETQTTVVRLTPAEEMKQMAIRVVEASKAPARLVSRGGLSIKQDYLDVLAELNKNPKDNVAIIVDMTPEAWNGVKKPEVAFANALRRRFDASGLSITAYQTGPLQITVRKLTAMEVKEREAARQRGIAANKKRK